MFFKIGIFICLALCVAVCSGGPLARALDLEDAAAQGAPLTRLVKRSPQFDVARIDFPCRRFGIPRCDPSLPRVLCRPYPFSLCQDTEFLEVNIK